jgi:hypothetical protein
MLTGARALRAWCAAAQDGLETRAGLQRSLAAVTLALLRQAWVVWRGTAEERARQALLLRDSVANPNPNPNPTPGALAAG